MSLLLLLVSLLVLQAIVIAALLRIFLRARARQLRLHSDLLASEMRHRQLLVAADLAMVVLDESCHVVDWNPAVEKLYECPREKALGQQFFLRYAPVRDGAALAARVMAMRGTDELFEFTFTLPVVGPERRIRWRARHFTDVRDGRRYLSLSGQDVTLQEAVLTQLADSEARFRVMFESLPVALTLIDTAGHLLMANQEFARFFGFDAPEQMVAMDVQELIHPDDRPASALALAALRARAESLYQMETRYLRRDGVVRWGNARAVMVELVPGQPCFVAQISDVHERKQTEGALMESERRLATLIANLSGAVYRYELPAGQRGLHHDLQPEFLSDGVECLTGKPRPLFLRQETAQSLGSLIEPDDRPALLAALMAAMAGDGRFQAVYRLRHGGSGLRWIAEHGLAWQRADGSWTVDGHLTDITAERQARQDEQVYRTLIADTHTGLITLNASGCVLEVNAPICTMLGVEKAEEVLGHSLEAFVPPGRADIFHRFLARVLKDGSLRDVGLTYHRRDGARLDLLLNAVAAPDGVQAVVKCLVLNISKTRRAETERRESEVRYRSLFDTSIDGICFLSLGGDIEAANPALCRLLGHAADDTGLLGTNLQEITAPALRKNGGGLREQVLARGFCESFRKEFVRADGSHVPVSVQAWLVRDENGAPLRIMCMVHDITEITRVEAERDALQKGLRQTRKMEAVGQLAGGIAHDFNNVLASMLGYAELAERREPVAQDEKLGMYLTEIRTAGERARNLIRQLLLFSRAGRNEARVQTISALVQDTVRMLRPTMPAGLRLRTQVSQDLPPVRADDIGLQQVMMNLVINARDASPPAGEVRVLARLADGNGLRCASCHALLSGHYVELAVSDQGAGITDEVRERIFDPFFTTKAQGKGTGMGLSVVHGVVHELGGHVVVESGMVGSSFRVLLPPALDSAPVSPVEHETVSRGQGQCILVVDDDPAVARMLGELLAAAGYRALPFTDSTRAAMLLEDLATPLAALITDQLMPGLEGNALVRLAHRYRPALPVLLLSAQPALLETEDGWPVLAKPVQGRDLLARLDELLQRPWQVEHQDIVLAGEKKT